MDAADWQSELRVLFIYMYACPATPARSNLCLWLLCTSAVTRVACAECWAEAYLMPGLKTDDAASRQARDVSHRQPLAFATANRGQQGSLIALVLPIIGPREEQRGRRRLSCGTEGMGGDSRTA